MCLHMCIIMYHMTTIACCWHQWVVQYSSVLNQTNKNHGENIQVMAGTNAPQQNTITVMVFVKETQCTRISDTVYFIHKYITQPTVTPTDVIIKAYQDLMQAIHGMSNTRGIAHMEALTHIGQVLEPQHKQIMDSKSQRKITKSNPDTNHPRVVFHLIKSCGKWGLGARI